MLSATQKLLRVTERLRESILLLRATLARLWQATVKLKTIILSFDWLSGRLTNCVQSMAADRAARKRSREILTVLTNVLPVPFPISLRWRPIEGFGESLVLVKKDGLRSAVIDLRADLSEAVAVETLCHEYAHLISTDYYGTSHDAVWGLAYSDVYKVVYGDH